MYSNSSRLIQYFHIIDNSGLEGKMWMLQFQVSLCVLWHSWCMFRMFRVSGLNLYCRDCTELHQKTILWYFHSFSRNRTHVLTFSLYTVEISENQKEHRFKVFHEYVGCFYFYKNTYAAKEVLHSICFSGTHFYAVYSCAVWFSP